MNEIAYQWRGKFENAAVNSLHAEAFGHSGHEDDWWGIVNRHSLGWVTAHDAAGIVGFVNVPWDGGVHAWIQDTMVAQRRRREGVGRRMIAVAVAGARDASCEWLHVDFDDELRHFYLDRCGFQETNAGLFEL